MDAISKVLSANIQKYRKLSGLTQEALSLKLGVTFQAVSKWENGKSSPDVLLLPLMAEAFGCSIDELFSYSPPQKSVSGENSDYVIKQIKSQIGDSESAEKFLSIIAMDSSNDLTDEKIERMIGELYRGFRKNGENE